MLKQRIITALILGPIVLAIVIMGNLKWFMALTAVIQMASCYEWLKMHRMNGYIAVAVSLILTAATCYVAHMIMIEPGLMLNFIMCLFAFVWLLALFWLYKYQLGKENKPIQLGTKALLGLLAISLFSVAFLLVRTQDLGQWWALILLLTIWVADIGAYFSGKTFGKHKLAINISPGKTWEGVFGAQVFIVFFALAVAYFMPIAWQKAIWVFPVVALFSVIGDLTASLGKRQAGVKDSSNLLPGHGGFIDRFDSLIAAAPLYLILLFLL